MFEHAGGLHTTDLRSSWGVEVAKSEQLCTLALKGLSQVRSGSTWETGQMFYKQKIASCKNTVRKSVYVLMVEPLNIYR